MSVATCTDIEFKQYKKQWTDKLQAIQLPQDLNSATGQYILSQLDECYAYLRIDLGDMEAAKDKSDSIIRQNERSKAEGKNEIDRKKNATEYLENYPIGEGPDDVVDMYEWNRLLNSRYAVVRGLVDIINNKQQRLITMAGFLKIDSSLGSGMH